MARQKVKIVRAVTRKHGEMFAEEWFETSCSTLEMYEVCGRAEIIVWPEDDATAQGDYIDIVDEITDRTLEAVKGAIAEAFVEIATEVLDREKRPRRVALIEA